MPQTTYRGRDAASLENSHLRVTVLREGGHIAEILDKQTGINPLWTPPWPSIEPSAYDARKHPEYGGGTEGRLLAGIMGHNLCLDIFGGPSPEEAAQGLSVHGEASVAPYQIHETGGELTLQASFPLAQIQFERRIALAGQALRIHETATSLASFDRPIGWTQHVSLGPPFLQCGATEFRLSATRSKSFETAFGSADYLLPGAEFIWPEAPCTGGGSADLQVFSRAAASSAFSTHLLDPQHETAFFVAYDPSSALAFGYVWKRADFPWMGVWEENHSRTAPPWNGKVLARGMEFGVSPFPESRRAMVDRGRLFDVPAYRWLPAKGRLEVEYWVLTQTAEAIPETLHWPQ